MQYYAFKTNQIYTNNHTRIAQFKVVWYYSSIQTKWYLKITPFLITEGHLWINGHRHKINCFSICTFCDRVSLVLSVAPLQRRCALFQGCLFLIINLFYIREEGFCWSIQPILKSCCFYWVTCIICCEDFGNDFSWLGWCLILECLFFTPKNTTKDVLIIW